ncbi:trem-like transcript 4 protein isoform X3 [Perca fluviatilis]|uniref:trem-like transcript 4 protein isoform X3 n=1 Tax=Perca fluviatilis TaxID=8168 RepID=UPI0019638C4A|nr:trem-like transcript 4 protein isoform X3 [Perca fluviatilis]
MRILHIVVFCCFSVVCAEASAVLEVSGHVGGEVSIHCSGSWTTNNSSEHYHMYFCKGVCSRETILIRTERKRLAGARRGRYSMEVNRGDGAFNVTIKRLKRVDAGTYRCGVENTFNVLHQEVNLIVVDAPTVPHRSPPSTTTLLTEAETLSRGSFASSTKRSPAASTLPATEAETNQPAANHLKDTTVAIIVSKVRTRVSLTTVRNMQMLLLLQLQ